MAWTYLPARSLRPLVLTLPAHRARQNAQTGGTQANLMTKVLQKCWPSGRHVLSAARGPSSGPVALILLTMSQKMVSDIQNKQTKSEGIILQLLRINENHQNGSDRYKGNGGQSSKLWCIEYHENVSSRQG